MAILKHFFENIESYVCRFLLVSFVTLLFAQIVSRELFGRSISWIEELSTYMFVWFVFFGASYAARLSAHNRVTVQFKPFPKIVAKVSESIADLLLDSVQPLFRLAEHRLRVLQDEPLLEVPDPRRSDEVFLHDPADRVCAHDDPDHPGELPPLGQRHRRARSRSAELDQVIEEAK